MPQTVPLAPQTFLMGWYGRKEGQGTGKRCGQDSSHADKKRSVAPWLEFMSIPSLGPSSDTRDALRTRDNLCGLQFVSQSSYIYMQKGGLARAVIYIVPSPYQPVFQAVDK